MKDKEVWYVLEGELLEAEERKALLYEKIKGIWEEMQYALKIADDTPTISKDAADVKYYAPKLIPSIERQKEMMNEVEEFISELRSLYKEYKGLLSHSSNMKKSLQNLETHIAEKGYVEE